uniref:Uncharacterized protein n=1 Tax=Megaselia scalaris TaxID=36166 RepID=T1GSB9_MEGSC
MYISCRAAMTPRFQL